MKKQVKTNSGWTMQGICHQYIFDRDDITNNEKIVYGSILRHSFGYGKRWCYLKYEDLCLTNRNTIKATISSLCDKGIISSKPTYKVSKDSGKKVKAMNEYKILEPSDKIVNFIFYGNKNEEPEEIDLTFQG